MASTGSQTVATLGTHVAERLQDPTSRFWHLHNEMYAGIEEAINDMMLLVGRPTIQYQTLVTLQPNTVWQRMPANMIALTNMRSNNYSLWKTSLHSMDYVQASWGPDWTADRANVPARWFPLGLTWFGVHPAPLAAIQVVVAGVSNPFTDAWPPTGAEKSPFNDEFNQALELYATAYCRLKEIGDDALEGNQLMNQYTQIAQRLTDIEDNNDALIFNQAFGTSTAASIRGR